jgi:hypothetical protein
VFLPCSRDNNQCRVKRTANCSKAVISHCLVFRAFSPHFLYEQKHILINLSPVLNLKSENSPTYVCLFDKYPSKAYPQQFVPIGGPLRYGWRYAPPKRRQSSTRLQQSAITQATTTGIFTVMKTSTVLKANPFL